jgi:hypothetical protein
MSVAKGINKVFRWLYPKKIYSTPLKDIFNPKKEEPKEKK